MLTSNEIKAILTLLNRVEVKGREEAFTLVLVCQKLERLLVPAQPANESPPTPSPGQDKTVED